jgi:hypothetical protein
MRGKSNAKLREPAKENNPLGRLTVRYRAKTEKCALCRNVSYNPSRRRQDRWAYRSFAEIGFCERPAADACRVSRSLLSSLTFVRSIPMMPVVPVMPATMAVPVVIPWSVIIWSVVIVTRLIVISRIVIWIVSWSVGEAEGHTRFRRLRSECRQTKRCESNKKIIFHSIVRLAILLGAKSPV